MLARGSFELCASATEWLLFHHLIDISSLSYFSFLPSKLLLPTALLESNYGMDVYHFPLMKLSRCQGSFRKQRCYIHTVDGSSTFSCVFGVVGAFVLHPLAVLHCAAHVYAAIESHLHGIMIMLVHTFLTKPKYEDESPSLFKCKRWERQNLLLKEYLHWL